MLLARHSACKENILEPTLEGASALVRSATGPLSPHLPAFITSLIDQRYAVVSVRSKAWRAVAFDTWLAHEGIELADIDWDSSRLRVRGKNGHECLMPLPTDVGEAIALYLQNGRPVSTDRHLFLRARAPNRGLKHGSDGVGSIVRNALERAAIDTPHKGAHQFRHALAVRLLQGGASLPEIGELLRHRSQISTSVYAKVDIVALRALAMPWPGSMP